MTTTSTKQSSLLKYEVVGSKRFSNYFWAAIVTMGGVGFLLSGLSCYLGKNLILVTDTSKLEFIPQGILLLAYGAAGLLLATYLWLTIIWDIGGGYNAFDKSSGQATIFRYGYPGKNRTIDISFPLEDIKAVKAEIKDGFSPKRSLYLKVVNKRDIPLTRAGQPIALADLENQGAELAKFLQIPLEGL
jgi:hypothetical protein